LVSGPSARQPCTAGGSEGIADFGEQTGELRGCRGRQAFGWRGPEFGELSVHVVPECRRGAGTCEKGCRWVAAAEKAEAPCIPEEMKGAAHAAGGKSLTPKASSHSGRWNWRLMAEGFNPSVRWLGWPRNVWIAGRTCGYSDRITLVSWKVRGRVVSTRRWISPRTSRSLRKRKSCTNESVPMGVPARTRPLQACRTPS
jgi:hypothetical protein